MDFWRVVFCALGPGRLEFGCICPRAYDVGALDQCLDWNSSRVRTTPCIRDDVCTGCRAFLRAFHHVVCPGRPWHASIVILQSQGFGPYQGIQSRLWDVNGNSAFRFGAVKALLEVRCKDNMQTDTEGIFAVGKLIT